MRLTVFDERLIYANAHLQTSLNWDVCLRQTLSDQ